MNSSNVMSYLQNQIQSKDAVMKVKTVFLCYVSMDFSNRMGYLQNQTQRKKLE